RRHTPTRPADRARCPTHGAAPAIFVQEVAARYVDHPIHAAPGRLAPAPTPARSVETASAARSVDFRSAAATAPPPHLVLAHRVCASAGPPRSPSVQCAPAPLPPRYAALPMPLVEMPLPQPAAPLLHAALSTPPLRFVLQQKMIPAPAASSLAQRPVVAPMLWLPAPADIRFASAQPRHRSLPASVVPAAARHQVAVVRGRWSWLDARLRAFLLLAVPAVCPTGRFRGPAAQGQFLRRACFLPDRE